MTWDATFKQIIAKELVDLEVRSDVSVGKLPLRIDLVIKKTKEICDTNSLTTFIHLLKKINIIEFKSSHDKITKADLTKLMGYVGLYCHNNNLGIQELKEVSGWYIITYKPKFIENLDISKVDEGIYIVNKSLFNFYIMIIDQLPVKRENMAFLLFSSEKNINKILKMIVKEGKLKRY